MLSGLMVRRDQNASHVICVLNPCHHRPTLRLALNLWGNQRCGAHTPHPEALTTWGGGVQGLETMRSKPSALWPPQPTCLHGPLASAHPPSATDKASPLLAPCLSQPAHPGPHPDHARVLLNRLVCRPPGQEVLTPNQQWPPSASLSPRLPSGLCIPLSFPAFTAIQVVLCIPSISVRVPASAWGPSLWSSPAFLPHSAPNPLHGTHIAHDPFV